MKGGHSNAWADIEGDGDLDLLVGGLHKTADGRPNFLFRNEVGSKNAWLALRMVAASPTINPDAIGTRVELVYPDRVLLREVRSSRGMYNASDTRLLYFGLGGLGCPQAVKVRWPDGTAHDFVGQMFGQDRQWVIDSAGRVMTPTATIGPEPTRVPTRTPVPTATRLVVPTGVPVGRTVFLPYGERP